MKPTRRTAALVAAAAAMMVASQWALGDGSRGGSKLPKKWIYGPAFNTPAPVPIWNPAKKRMNAGLLTNGGTIGGPTTNYCNVANRTGEGSSDFTWTEMQHSPIDWNQAWTFWALPCATDLVRERGIVPGIRAAYTNVREIQKAVDGGAMVVVLPTLDSVQEAKDAVQMAYYPPIGKRKYGPGQWQTLYANVPGGYRQTFNDNFVLWVMIETIEGSKAAYEIAQVPGIHARVRRDRRPGQLLRLQQRPERLRLADLALPQRRACRGQAGVHGLRAAQPPGPHLHLHPELIREPSQ